MWKCPPQSVLVPVDFSDASARALGLAGLVASAFDAGLVALHAETLEAPPYFTHDQIDALERERQVARASGLQFVVGFAAKQTAYAVQATVVERPPAEAILEATRSSDLVIMGTHGRRGPSRWWLGSVAERVVRDATVPVLVMRAEAPATTETFAKIQMLAHRGAPLIAARQWADLFASTFGGQISEAGDTDTCDPASIQQASLAVVAVPMEHSARGVAESITHLLRRCTRPVLFVPA
jgi:nucleotide-binding universal stress UspA family protein